MNENAIEWLKRNGHEFTPGTKHPYWNVGAWRSEPPSGYVTVKREARYLVEWGPNQFALPTEKGFTMDANVLALVEYP